MNVGPGGKGIRARSSGVVAGRRINSNLRLSSPLRLAQRPASVLHLASNLRQHSPAMRVSAASARLSAGRVAMLTAMERGLRTLRHRLNVAGGTLDVVSPLATLRRGYAIVEDAAGHVVADAGAVQPGDALRARLARGVVEVRVERSIPPDSSKGDSG